MRFIWRHASRTGLADEPIRRDSFAGEPWTSAKAAVTSATSDARPPSDSRGRSSRSRRWSLSGSEKAPSMTPTRCPFMHAAGREAGDEPEPERLDRSRVVSTSCSLVCRAQVRKSPTALTLVQGRAGGRSLRCRGCGAPRTDGGLPPCFEYRQGTLSERRRRADLHVSPSRDLTRGHSGHLCPFVSKNQPRSPRVY